jgi:hypothetical protein
LEYEERIVCFLDILGFKDHISQSVKPDGTSSVPKVDQLAKALSRIREILDVDRPAERVETEVTQFSDSIALSFLSTAESGVFFALLSILWIQISLIFEGIVCRGGVAKGKLIHTPKMLFGPAMIEAYLLESKTAIYPRVVLNKSIVEAGKRARARHHDTEHEQKSIMDLLRRDKDGMYYIDYLTRAQSELDDPEYEFPEYLYLLQQIISSGLKSKDSRVAAKYGWMKDKFAPYLSKVKRGAQRSRSIDREVRDAYLSIPDL